MAAWQMRPRLPAGNVDGVRPGFAYAPNLRPALVPPSGLASLPAPYFALRQVDRRARIASKPWSPLPRSRVNRG